MKKGVSPVINRSWDLQRESEIWGRKRIQTEQISELMNLTSHVNAMLLASGFSYMSFTSYFCCVLPSARPLHPQKQKAKAAVYY